MSDLVEKAKRAAAYAAVDDHVKSGFAVGIGSGSTVVYAVERLAARIASGELSGIVCVPTSFQSLQLIRQHRLTLTDLEQTPQLDVAIDGADETDKSLTCIKGGGGCHTREKIVAAASKKFVVVADYRKDSRQLGEQWTKGIPVEVIPMAYASVARRVEEVLGKAPVLRLAVNKAGPVVTDNGNFILDCPFATADPRSGPHVDWASVAIQLKMIPGVVETGLFVGMAAVAYFGGKDGSVRKAVPE